MGLIAGRNMRLVTIIALLLCSVFTYQIVNRALFQHTHQIEDGRVISHAHPYDKSEDSTPFKNHIHTNAELLFLDQVDILFAFIVVLLALVTLLKAVDFVYVTRRYSQLSLNFKLGRAPPVA